MFKEVYHLQKGLQNALKLIFLAILHLSASESIKKIDLNINAFEIWHFEFFVELFFSFVFYKSKVIFFQCVVVILKIACQMLFKK